MNTHNLIVETTVYEAADRVAANAPPAVTLGRFDIELEPPGPPRRPSPSLAATRIDGAWRRGRRSGRVTIAGSVIEAFRATYLPRQHDGQRLEQLTEREREVLTLVGRGMSNQEIAEALVVTESTVKTHIGHVFEKLALRDRAAAIVLAYEHGLVLPGQAG